MVTLALLGLVLAIFSSAMVTMFDRVHTAGRRSESNDAIRLAIEEIDRQVRSGNVIHDPELEVLDPGMSLRIYTQTNAPTALDANRCVQWRVADGLLRTRSWSADGSNVSGWRTVADNLQNTPGSTAFSFDDTNAGFGQRTLRVHFIVNRDAAEGRDVEIGASLTGRNVQFGYPLTLCDTIPPE
jgi:type II secretory pathway pseudopilin PulG